MNITLAEIATSSLSAHRTDSPRARTTAAALVIGRPIRLHKDLRSGLVDQGVEVTVRNPYAHSDQLGGVAQANRSAPDGVTVGGPITAETIIVSTEALSGGRGLVARWRECAAQSEENNRIAAAVVDASSEYSTCRLLVVCDGRAVSRAGAGVHNAKRLAQRLKYEVEVDGTPVVSTSYLVLGTTSPLRESIEAIARWCRRETAPILQ
ncbi:hypothetical protein E5720_17150 [Rhodococcus sp. PAMC28707]|uniref:hypothetical protein n=1 Tax=unclassified Rhodococcus (in: high G+C Gram-positive bacteria) TaxID=192944 RepID=UPI00109DA318|nr:MULTISPECIES: hypothetical protein [unclassified Rhodococcus (in: high G+C Gram-positive bacteria)]QCB51867.1 hypothetical protein E5769_18370 [Rhodococcus sp. PAMC28705]QCB59964.1 hypothetical protein E5720_17150 [Rhodococcus sp. PAMC28707]